MTSLLFFDRLFGKGCKATCLNCLKLNQIISERCLIMDEYRKLKSSFSKKPTKKIFSPRVGKLNLNLALQPTLPQWPKFKFIFLAIGLKIFLAGFLEKFAFKISVFLFFFVLIFNKLSTLVIEFLSIFQK